MLNIVLKILVKGLTGRLQVELTGPEQTFSVRERTFQDKIHLAPLIIGQIGQGIQ